MRHGVHDALAAPEYVSVEHGEHVPLPSGAAYPAAHAVLVALPSHSWPAGHDAHSRLTETVGATVWYCFGPHADTAAQAEPLSSKE